jgi:hypothetical protein
MIRIGLRQFEVPLWLWLAVPLAWVVYAAYGATSYGIDYFNPDSYYLSVVRQCAVGALAGFLLADLARRCTVPWYGLLFLMAASFAASSFAINRLNAVVYETARVVSGFAISLASSVGGAGAGGFVLLIVSVAVPLLGGVLLALAFTVVSRLLIGAPLWAAGMRREFWPNLGAAMLWLVVAFGGYIAIRSAYGLALGHSATAVPRWLPLTAAGVGALAATAVQLWLAYRFRRNESREFHDLRVWLLAVICVAAFFYSPSLFGLTGSRIMYDHIRPMLRTAHLLPTPEISIANYRVNVPFHDYKIVRSEPMPDGKPSYLSVILPEEYGLSSEKFGPRVLIYLRDITSQQATPWWTSNRKQLEDTKAVEPGKDAVVRFAVPRGAIGLRSDEYPEVDAEIVGFDPAVSTETAEQALRRFLRERLRRVAN